MDIVEPGNICWTDVLSKYKKKKFNINERIFFFINVIL